jgi:hypothetical protein
MEPGDDSDLMAVRWRGGRPRRPPLECRECGLICERLVSPWRCLRSRCVYVYSYEDGDTTYFGCLEKVFSPELDLAAFLDDTGEVRGWPDPYGTIRATRAPRRHCPVVIERAYGEGVPEGCRNPGFYKGSAPEGRQGAGPPGAPFDGRGGRGPADE